MKRFSQILSFFLVAILWWACHDIHQELETMQTPYSTNNISQTRSVNTSEEKYYWHKGEKIKLYKQEGQKYVLRRESQSLSRSIDEPIERWRLEDSDKLKDTTNIIYNSDVYTTINGDNALFSNLFFVKLKRHEDYAKLEDMASLFNVNILGNVANMDLWYKLSCDSSTDFDAITLANIFYESGLFKYSHPDPLQTIASAGTTSVSLLNDPYYSHQWHLHSSNDIDIDYPEAMQITTGIPEVKIAVIDIGLPYVNHEDLSFSSLNTYYYDKDTFSIIHDYGGEIKEHATACTGIINATHNNNKGGIGIAPNCSIWAFSLGGNLNAEYIAEFFNLLGEHNISVASNSWRTENNIPIDLIDDAISDAISDGCVVVFAAGNNYGNNDGNTISYPANCDDRIIVVGAVNKQGEVLKSSNYSAELDIVAPGTDIITCSYQGMGAPYDYNENYVSFEQTSSACPQVAAVAGLILSTDTTLTVAEVTERILRTTTKNNTSGIYNQYKEHGAWCEEYGYGMLNAYNAISAFNSAYFGGNVVISEDTTCNVVGNATLLDCQIMYGANVDITASSITIHNNFSISSSCSLHLHDYKNTPADNRSFVVYPKEHNSIFPGSFGPTYDSCYLN